jgi:hypothetical protein
MRSYSKGIKLDVKKNAILKYNLFFRIKKKKTIKEEKEEQEKNLCLFLDYYLKKANLCT